MISFAHAAWKAWTRLRATPVARCFLVATVFSIFAMTAAWDSPNSARPSKVTLLYVGASDCAPCRAWQNGEGTRFRASAEFARVTYREVKSPTLRDALNDAHWPDDLRGYRGQLGPAAGVPLWLIIGDEEILGRGFGASQWRDVVLPRIRALTR